MNRTTKRFLFDIGERTARTFVAAVIAAWTASGLDLWSTITNIDALQKIGLAGATAAMTLLIGLATKWAGGRDTASVVSDLSVDETADERVAQTLKGLQPLVTADARRAETNVYLRNIAQELANANRGQRVPTPVSNGSHWS